jgi:hippurate hydrolase
MPPEVLVNDEFTPAGFNDPALTNAAADLFRQLVGDESVEEKPPTMGGEDFARFARHLGVPGLQFAIGSINREKFAASEKPGAAPLPSLHSALYAPDAEPTIRSAVGSMANLAASLLRP